jgi:predicted nucleotidyltransferase
VRGTPGGDHRDDRDKPALHGNDEPAHDGRDKPAGGVATAQARSIVELARTVLGTDLAGVCLHGSAVLSGLRPTSDLDLLVITRRVTSEVQRHALGSGLLDLSPRPPWLANVLGGTATSRPGYPVELSVVAQAEVRPWRYPPRREFQYGEWLREQFERGEIGVPAPCPDLAIHLSVALQADAPVFGPSPRELLDPVPAGDVARASLGGVPDLIADLEWDTRNVILTLARVWTTLVTGEIRSKDAAADWVLARLDRRDQPVLARARAEYLGAEVRGWADAWPQVQAYVRHVTEALDQLAGPSTGRRSESFDA